MHRISSPQAFFYKRIFPIVWVGLGILLGATGLSAALSNGKNISGFISYAIVLCVVLTVGVYFNRKYVSDLVDEVWDDGDALVVKNKGQEQRIALADITNVSYAAVSSLPRVELSLRQPTAFGDRVAFCPPVQLMPLGQSPVIADLIKRVDQARESYYRR